MDQQGSPSHSLENSPPRGDAGPESPGSGVARAPAPPPLAREHEAEKRTEKPARPQPVERPLTIGQVQRMLEMRLGFTVSQNALARWCRQCKIRAVRLGYEWRIPREVVEEIIKMAQLGDRF
jgi:hypothetical protein